MTCDSALAAMLDAELAELSPHHQGPLGRHLRDCARCRRVAERLRDDSAHLAAMIQEPRVARAATPVRALPWVGGVVAAAAVALMVQTAPAPAPDGGGAASAKPGGTTAQALVPATTQAPVRRTAEAMEPTQGPLTAPPARPASVLVVTPSDAAVPVAFDPPAATDAAAFDPPSATVAVAYEPPCPVAPVPLSATPTLAVVPTAPRDRPMPSPNRRAVAVPSRLPGVTALWFN